MVKTNFEQSPRVGLLFAHLLTTLKGEQRAERDPRNTESEIMKRLLEIPPTRVMFILQENQMTNFPVR